jgi:hypothetical protein
MPHRPKRHRGIAGGSTQARKNANKKRKGDSGGTSTSSPVPNNPNNHRPTANPTSSARHQYRTPRTRRTAPLVARPAREVSPPEQYEASGESNYFHNSGRKGNAGASWGRLKYASSVLHSRTSFLEKQWQVGWINVTHVNCIRLLQMRRIQIHITHGLCRGMPLPHTNTSSTRTQFTEGIISIRASGGDCVFASDEFF